MSQDEESTPVRIPAAQYLRCSTEVQQYSLLNQSALILDYARRMGYAIVRTYCDGSRSGLGIKDRSGLRQLLADVMSGSAAFRVVLVYDVSRWGRFQDPDESAHYEYLCKQSGITVEYCAEPFRNDQSPQNRLIKSLKRSMAAEFSRELSVKVIAAQKRLAKAGFSQGAMAGFGLRRLMVSSRREPKRLLKNGERKNLQSDHVLWVPGPEEEVATVREIFRMFVEEERSVNAIVAELNRRGGPRPTAAGWNWGAVEHILQHPKYSGCSRFGYSTQRLGSAKRRTSREDWISCPGAIPAIVDQATFEKAQNLIAERTQRLSDSDYLQRLRELLRTKGKLSVSLLRETDRAPCAETYAHRFGSLARAFELVGFTSTGFQAAAAIAHTRRMHEILLNRVVECCAEPVSIIRPGWRKRPYLRLRNGRIVSVYVCAPLYTPGGRITWAFSPVLAELRHFALLGFLSMDKEDFVDYHLIPRLPRQKRMHVSPSSWLLKTGIHLFRLKDLAMVAGRLGFQLRRTCDASEVMPLAL